MRKLKTIFSLLLFAGSAVYAHAAPANHDGHLGLGLALGEPTGISGKYWLTRGESSHEGAIDGLLAYSLNDDFFFACMDYDIHFRMTMAKPGEFFSAVRPYIGVGGALFGSTRSYKDAGSGSAGLGVRIPLGAEWEPQSQPIGVFLEIAPGVGILPGTFGFLNADIGIRYYF